MSPVRSVVPPFGDCKGVARRQLVESAVRVTVEQNPPGRGCKGSPVQYPYNTLSH